MKVTYGALILAALGLSVAVVRDLTSGFGGAGDEVTGRSKNLRHDSRRLVSTLDLDANEHRQLHNELVPYQLTERGEGKKTVSRRLEAATVTHTAAPHHSSAPSSSQSVPDDNDSDDPEDSDDPDDSDEPATSDDSDDGDDPEDSDDSEDDSGDESEDDAQVDGDSDSDSEDETDTTAPISGRPEATSDPAERIS